MLDMNQAFAFVLFTTVHYILYSLYLLISNLTMMQTTTEGLNAWKTEMHTYEKNKRTKKPFGKSLEKP